MDWSKKRIFLGKEEEEEGGKWRKRRRGGGQGVGKRGRGREKERKWRVSRIRLFLHFRPFRPFCLFLRRTRLVLVRVVHLLRKGRDLLLLLL